MTSQGRIQSLLVGLHLVQKRFGEVKGSKVFRVHLHPNALKRIPILTGLNPCCSAVVSENQRYTTEGIRGAALTFLNDGLSPLKKIQLLRSVL